MQSAQKTTANDFPLYLFHQGKNFEAHKFFGAHPFRRGRGQFYRFRVWAPHAKSVSVIGSFNQWDRTCHPMYKISDTVWEAELPRLKQFDSYKYSIETEDGIALIAVVGRGMCRTRGVAARIFAALAHAHINVRMIDQGSSELNVIVAVKETDFEQAIRCIYDMFVNSVA